MWIFLTNHNMGLVRFLWISSVLMWILWCGLCPFIVMLDSNVDMWKISLNRTEHLTSFHFWYQLSFVPCVRRIPLGVIVSVIQRFDVHFWQVYSCLMWMNSISVNHLCWINSVRVWVCQWYLWMMYIQWFPKYMSIFDNSIAASCGCHESAAASCGLSMIS